MGTDRAPDWRWVEGFAERFAACELRRGEAAVVARSASSRPDVVATALMALRHLGVDVVDMVMPEVDGELLALVEHPGVLAGLVEAGFVADCTPTGLLGAPELAEIRASGTRGVTIAPEHPGPTSDLALTAEDASRVERYQAAVVAAGRLSVSSATGTELVVDLADAAVEVDLGVAATPGSWARWPGGSLAVHLDPRSADGQIVVSPGDLLADLGRLASAKVTFSIVAGRVSEVAGAGLETEMVAWLFGERGGGACIVSAVRLGCNSSAQWQRAAVPDEWGRSAAQFGVSAGVVGVEVSCRNREHSSGLVSFGLRRCSVSVDEHDLVRAGTLT